MNSEARLRERLRGEGARQLVGHLLVTVMVVWARMHERGFVLVDQQVLSQDGDSAYHLRRMVELALRPSYPGLFDPLTNWPRGSSSMWAPGFDWLGAAFIWLMGADNRIDAARAAAMLPVVLGVVAAMVVMRLARRLLPDRPYVPVAAGLLYAFIPVCIDVGMVGRTDHHVSEQLCLALLMLWMIALGGARAASRAQRLGVETAGVIVLAGSVWLQTIALAFIAPVGLAIFALAARRSNERYVLAGTGGPAFVGTGGPAFVGTGGPAFVGTGGPAFVGAALVLAALFAPAVAAHGRAMSYAFPSYFQPVALLAGGVAVLAATAFHHLPPRKTVRLGFAAAMAGLWIGGLLLAAPLRRAITGGLVDYMATGNAWLSGNVELRTPFRLFPEPTQWIDVLLGSAGWLAPVSIPAALWWLVRRDRFSGVAMALVTVPLVALALAQARWVRPFGVLLALCTAVAIDRGGAALAARLRHKGARAPRFAYALVMLAGLTTVLLREGRYLGEPRVLPASASVHGAAIYLRHHGREPTAGNRSGVLVDWSLGYLVLAIAERPILAGGFGPFAGEEGFELERRAWYGSQAELWRLMDERDLGYVVAGWDSFRLLPYEQNQAALDLGAQRPNPEYYRGVPLTPLVTAGAAIPEWDVPHLEQLCPVYASPLLLREFAFPLPKLWVYERVVGAQLQGRAPAGSRVIAEMPLSVGVSEVPYAAYVDVGAEGTFTLRFPLPTSLRTGTLSSPATLRIHRAGAPVVTVAVAAESVHRGAVVQIPDD